MNTYFLEFDDERSGGFASCEIGNKLTEEERWAKLRLVKEVAGTLIVSDHNSYEKTGIIKVVEGLPKLLRVFREGLA